MAFTLILLSFSLTLKEASFVPLQFNFQDHATKVAPTVSYRQYGKLSKTTGYKWSTPTTMNFASLPADWWLCHSYQSGRSPSTILNWSNRSPTHSLSWIVFWATLRTWWTVFSCNVEDGNRTNNHLEGWHRNFNAVISRPHPNVYQLNAGSQPPRRRRKYNVVNQHLKLLKEAYVRGEKAIDRYIVGVAYNLSSFVW